MRLYRIKNTAVNTAVEFDKEKFSHLYDDENIKKYGYYYTFPYIIVDIDSNSNFEGASTLKSVVGELKAIIRDNKLNNLGI